MHKPVRIGITGGIGSGKSTVCNIFKILNIPVFNADDIAKNILNTNVNAIKSVKEIFGNNIYINNELDRKALSDIVFNNPALLKQLNEITHPAVFETFENWANTQTSSYIIKEAALIFETIAHQYLDYIITVVAPFDLKIKRLQSRDGSSIEQIEARMSKQLSDEEKISRSDFVIYNDDSKLLIPQALAIHNQFIKTTD